jgi:hypothetical protein
MSEPASAQTFGWRPDGTTTCTDWGADRGVEMTLGRKRPKAPTGAAIGECQREKGGARQ